MRIKFLVSAFCAALLVSGVGFAGTTSSETEVRAALERAFAQLRGGEFAALYQALPTASQQRISQARFTSALSKTRGMFELDRLDVERVHVSGDTAVAETVVYGRIERPFAGEGKIAVQQFLVREQGNWRVATGDQAMAKRLLANRPELARRVAVREPRAYIKRDGQWVELGSLANLRRTLQR